MSKLSLSKSVIAGALSFILCTSTSVSYANNDLPDLGTAAVNTFSLEKETELDHYRPYYTWACEKTHAQSKANYGNLGTNNERVFLVGPSTKGLLEPIDCTSLSLTIISAACMSYYPCMDSIVATKLLAPTSKFTSETSVNDNKEC